jgi:hypothetical protein
MRSANDVGTDEALVPTGLTGLVTLLSGVGTVLSSLCFVPL